MKRLNQPYAKVTCGRLKRSSGGGAGRRTETSNEFDDLSSWRVFVRLGLQVLLPADECVLKMRVGVMATEYTQACISDPPWPVAGQLAANQMGRLAGRGLVPVEIEVEDAHGMRKARGNQLFTAIGVTQDERRGHAVYGCHVVGY